MLSPPVVLAETEQLLDREGDLDQLAKLATTAKGGSGRAALIEGPAGIGKSSVLAATLARVEAAGFETLRARASELERDFAFGLVRQLFEPRVARLGARQRREVFAGAPQHAAALFESADDLGAGEASHAVLHGLYWLTVNLAGGAPLAIVVDDGHWGDAPSLRFLAYLVNRLDELPVFLVVAARPFEPDAETDLLDELAASPVTRVVRPAPLGGEAVASVVRAAFKADPDPGFCAACQEATGGNPLLLNELLFTLAEEGVEPTAADKDRVTELAPPTVVRSVARRLRRLDPEATEVARAAAILGNRADAGSIARLAGIDQAAVSRAARALARADILREDGLEFRHPLVRTAIYSELPAPDRSSRHHEAARALADQGEDEDGVVLHLLAADPNGESWAVDALSHAARRAHSRGAPDVAATYLERALAETPGPAGHAELLVELGLAELDALRFSGFARMRQALDVAEDPPARARAALRLGRCHFAWGDLPGAALVFEDELARLGDADPTLRAQLDAHHLCAAITTPGLAGGVRERVERLWQQRDDISDPVVLLALATAGSSMFPPARRGAELAERALADDEISIHDDPGLVGMAGISIMGAGGLESARRLWDRSVVEARNHGAIFSVGFAWTLRAQVSGRLGELAAAEADARGVVEDLSGEGALLPLTYVLPSLIDVLIEQGKLDEASKLIERYELGGALPDLAQMNFLLDSTARLRIAQGRVEEGIGHLRECGRRLEQWGVRNPGFLAWRGTLALGLAATGEQEEALALAREELELAGAFEVPRELGMAMRAAALVEGGNGATELLRESVAVLEESPARLEHARSLTDLGAALRRGGHRADAREPLRAGLDLAQSCGATMLAERAHQELVATGARPRRLVLSGVDSLTASERRVAEMASEGLTNREVAQALFVTEKTVEGHLGHAYRKLDISSRSELPKALIRQPEPAAA
jgi:DNA-binding CsgD family transcriptional regulator